MSARLNKRWLVIVCMTIGMLFQCQIASSHGSVSVDDDLCAIKIGYFKAHFKIYLPQSRQHKDYCEDIPATGESIFVMEYMHTGLGEIPIDFRIIRNETGMGKFARWEDVEDMADVAAQTVFYRPAAIVPDVFTVLYQFDEPGEYIGIVTALPQDGGKTYTAVFPFEVGFTGFGYWPLILVLAVVLQANYWLMSGRFSRRRQVRPIAAVRNS